MVDDALSYLEGVRDRPVWQPMPASVMAALTSPAPRDPSSLDAVYAEFRETILPYPMGNIHPRFWAWYMGSGTVAGALADFWAGILNSNLGGGHHAPNRVEAQVVNWMKALVSFPAEAGGLLTSGGSMANFIGLAAARDWGADVDVRARGMGAQPRRLAVYASDEVHSCNQKAVELLGLGTEALRLVPGREDFCADLPALRARIAEDRALGWKPICVIGTAGTVNTGAVDDLHAMADLCAEEGLWFHIDAAIGGVGMLSEAVRPLLRGMERADSVALDLHKWLHIPFEAGCALVRREEAHRKAFSLIPAYLEHGERGIAGESLWFSDYGLQLSRHFRALKVWMTIKEHGLDRLGRMMTRNVEQARYLGEQIDAHPALERLAPVGLDIVCFRYNPGGCSEAALEALNREILLQLQEAGIAAPSDTRLRGRYCLRVAIANHRSTREDFDMLVVEVERLGKSIAGHEGRQTE
jgi:glutamate/tyrosine decarboxylase-like PLP-dependent enzyme